MRVVFDNDIDLQVKLPLYNQALLKEWEISCNEDTIFGQKVDLEESLMEDFFNILEDYTSKRIVLTRYETDGRYILTLE